MSHSLSATSGQRNYRIYDASAAWLSQPVTTSEFRRAVATAANVWNESAHSGVFKYEGSFVPPYTGWDPDPNTVPGIPDQLSDCQAEGKEHSLVRVSQQIDGALARAYARCRDGHGEATQFEIVVFANVSQVVKKKFFLESGLPLPANHRDVLSTLIHEFGHTLNLGHTVPSVIAVMRDSLPATSVAYRELYTYDLDCSYEVGGHRDLIGWRRHQNVNGLEGTESAWTGVYNVSKASVGPTWQLGYQSVGASLKTDVCWAWTRELNSANTYSTNGIAPTVGTTTATVYRDYAQNQDRVTYPSREGYSGWLVEDSYSQASRRRLKYTRSTDGFQSTSFNGGVNVCSTMTGFMTCGSQAHAFTGQPPGVAWDGRNGGRTIIAWSNQNRLADLDDRRVHLTAGVISNTQLPTPATLPIRSSIPPAVACGGAATYNCVLGYVEATDTYNTMLFHRFRHLAPGDGNCSPTSPTLCLELEGGASSLFGAYTSSRVALWYSDAEGGRFRVAFRTDIPEQPIAFEWSVDGASWQWDTTTPLTVASVIGPTAQSTTTVRDNDLVYAR